MNRTTSKKLPAEAASHPCSVSSLATSAPPTSKAPGDGKYKQHNPNSPWQSLWPFLQTRRGCRDPCTHPATCATTLWKQNSEKRNGV
uniref:Uncharacterized protein n=1 Tax=Aegilops tauschii subsp. strangulata TaxID=200361 RepID=A0A453C052_AEGTS